MIKTVAKGTVVYALGNYIPRGCAYLLWFLRINRLTPSASSIIAEFYGYIALGQVIYLSMDMIYCRFIPKLGKQYAFNTVITVILIISILLSSSILIAAPQIAQITNHLSHIRYFYYVALILPLDALLYIAYANLRVEQKTTRFLLVKFIQAFTEVIFGFILLYFPTNLTAIAGLICASRTLQLHAIDTIFIANLASSILALSFLLSSFKGVRLVWHNHTIQMIWRYALSVFLTVLFLRLNDLLPQLLFRKLVPYNFYSTHTTEEILGNYVTSYKLTLPIMLAIQAFKYALEPFLFAHADRKDAPKLYSQLMHLFIWLSCLSLLLLSVNIDWIAKILIPNASYRYTIDTIPYLAFVHIVLGIYYNLSVAFKVSNHAQYTIWISLCGTFITGTMLLLLIPKFGHWGCVYASISGAAAMALLGYGMGQKCYPISYYKQGFVLLLVTFFALGKVPLWPAKLAFLGIGWAYLLLNITILCIFFMIGMSWHKSANLLQK